jgi:hypothetical protein
VGIENIMPIRGIPKDESDKFVYGLFAAAGNAAKNLNFYTIKDQKRFTPKQKTIAIFSVIAAIVILTSGGILFAINFESNRMQRLMDEYQAYILDPQVRDAVRIYNESVTEIAALTETLENLERYENIVGNTTIMTRDTVNTALFALLRVDRDAEIRRVTFDSDRRSMIIDCFSAEPLMVSEFVESLRNTDVFSEIVYYRYASQASGGTQSGFVYTLECFVKEVKSVD